MLRDNLVEVLISISFVLAVFHAANRRTRNATLSAGKAAEPITVVSWLPWIGSGLQYVNNPLTFFKMHGHSFSFKFKFFGQTFVAISSPKAVWNLFNDRSGSFDIYNGQNIHFLTGIKLSSKDRVPYLYSVLRQKVGPPLYRALMPSRLPIISSRFTEELLKALKQIDLTSNQFSLDDFVHRTLYHTTSIALLGSDFPLETYENFMIFDEGAGLQIRHLGIFARASSAARESVFTHWTRYFVEHWVPEKDGYLAGATDMISDAYRGLKQSDLSHDEVHRSMFALLFGIHSNLMKLTAWVMCHIITDKDIYTRVCQEIRSFVDQEFTQMDSITKMDPRVLYGDSFRFLNSVIQEVIRTKSALGPVRVATRDAVLMDDDDKGIFIRKGEVITVNLLGMHHSPSLQEEPEVFKADRFMNGETYKSYSFGAGKHICPGRNYANFAVRQFIVLTLAMYDIQVGSNPSDDCRSLPELDGALGLKVMTFFRQKNDLAIVFHPTLAGEERRLGSM